MTDILIDNSYVVKKLPFTINVDTSKSSVTIHLPLLDKSNNGKELIINKIKDNNKVINLVSDNCYINEDDDITVLGLTDKKASYKLKFINENWILI